MSQTVARAIEILEFVSQEPRNPADVARHLDVHRSTALRLLETLTESALTRRHADGRYGVGYRLAGLAQLALEQFDLSHVARPHLARLCERSTHTVHLAVLDGDRVIYADKLEPPRSVRLYSQVGLPVALHAAGVAKAILAFRSPATTERLLRGCRFEPHTGTTLTDRDAYLAQLADVRARGWAVDDGEFEDYVNCVAMPIRDASGEVTAAVSVTALKARAGLPELHQLLPALGEAASAISKELGWKP
ncbi:IclR family transcriptional regulator [Streptomyces sp. SL13]|uniref:IclR family transcriptional regulator n=1 Tax=Streptantibioticus silvisoli TaxID=2705255 RepID=A0AA90H7F7_9ACTN|nr:IclR family transcriptional regulator [Streptantibioticus silvisoli]MDI5972308.1 IclR family transcriptional regulator [Streptantibioticus silvisoli]